MIEALRKEIAVTIFEFYANNRLPYISDMFIGLELVVVKRLPCTGGN